MMWRADGSVSWPTVEGVVQRSSVEKRTPARFHAGGIPLHTREGGYELIVHYAYTVATRVHVSEQWSFRGNLILEDEASVEAKARQYQEATPVVVHYDPADPSRSVLKTGDHGTGLWKAVWGGALLLYALYGYLSR